MTKCKDGKSSLDNDGDPIESQDEEPRRRRQAERDSVTFFQHMIELGYVPEVKTEPVVGLAADANGPRLDEPNHPIKCQFLSSPTQPDRGNGAARDDIPPR